MNVLYDLAYLCAAPVALPLLAIKSWRTGKYRTDWGARLGRLEGAAPGAGMRRLMLHCVSVGELASMRLLIDRLLAADAGLFIILTTTTDTGTARAREIYRTPGYAGRVATFRYPLDLSFAVEAFLDHTQPQAIALVELETWPNFVSIAAARRIPVAIINGRLTARSASRYALIRPVMASMLRQITWMGIQTPTIARRFLALGAAPSSTVVIPTLKYDSADTSATIGGQQALADACGIRPAHLLFVGGSTAPGEEAPLLDAYLGQRATHPNLRVAIAPRQPTAVPPVLEAAAARNLRPVLRSDRPDGTPGGELAANEVLILNTFGELRKLYNLATCVFVGRSLVKLGGSDMIEVAALGKPLCFGPHTHNFAEVVELLLSNDAATVISDAPALEPWLAATLGDLPAARATGVAAQRLIVAQKGSTQKYVEKLLSLLQSASKK